MSILTSAYNNRKFVEDYANSLLNQRYRPLEVVYVDDCSPDQNSKVLESMRSRFDRAGIELKILRNKKRKKCGSSYRRALRHATGEFFGVVDADDMLTKDATEYVMSLYKKFDYAGWIYTQFEFRDRNMQKPKPGWSKVPKNGKTLLDLADKRIHAYSHWRTFSTRVPGYEKLFDAGLPCAVDKQMGYLLEESSPGIFADKVCYFYRNGVPKCISKTESTIKVWKDVIAEAKERRKKNKIEPYRIKKYSGKA